MKPTTLALISIIALNNQSALAMDTLPLITIPMSSSTQHSALKYIPKQLALLSAEEPISDELLHMHNPNWRRIEFIEEISKKNQILAAAAEYDDEELPYEIRRCIIALAICSGANPNHKCLYDYTPLHVVLIEQDYPLAAYLLSKGADANRPSKEHYSRKVPLVVCKTTQLAQLLIDHEAQIPKDILSTCCRGDYPPDLIALYLRNNASIEPDICKSTALHTLSSLSQKGEQKLEKARLLLAAGINPAAQNKWGNTMLHQLAGARVKYDETKEFCRLVINHYIKQHAGFLTFLCYLQQNFWYLYKQKGLLKQYFPESVSHMKQLYAFLGMKNYQGQRAYDIWNIEELNPDTCSYRKYRSLPVKKPHSISQKTSE